MVHPQAEDSQAAQAARVFGLGAFSEPPRRVTEAWSNEVFRVRTGAGEYALKLFPRDLGDERLTALRTATVFEATVLDGGEIPMPAPVAAAETGKWLAEVDTFDGTRLARCHRWVEGLPATAGLPLPLSAVRDVGRSLAVLHVAKTAAGDTSALPPVDLDRWLDTVSGAGSAGFDWADGLAALTPLVEDLAARLAELREARLPMVLSHGDLDPKNAVVRPDGRVALTDWDGARPVLPGVELVVTAVSFARNGHGEPLAESIAAFVSAYREAGGAAVPDPRLMVAETSDVGWLLRNVEACIAAKPGEDLNLRHRLARGLVGSFASDVRRMAEYADRI